MQLGDVLPGDRRNLVYTELRSDVALHDAFELTLGRGAVPLFDVFGNITIEQIADNGCFLAIVTRSAVNSSYQPNDGLPLSPRCCLSSSIATRAPSIIDFVNSRNCCMAARALSIEPMAGTFAKPCLS